MTATRYQRHARLLAVPVSMAWGILYVLLAAGAILYWARFSIEHLHRVPNVELMKWTAVIGSMVITGYAYHVFVPWWQDTLEAWRLARLGWEHGL